MSSDYAGCKPSNSQRTCTPASDGVIEHTRHAHYLVSQFRPRGIVAYAGSKCRQVNTQSNHYLGQNIRLDDSRMNGNVDFLCGSSETIAIAVRLVSASSRGAWPLLSTQDNVLFGNLHIMRGDSYCLYHAQYRVYADRGSSQEALPIPAACLTSHVSRTTPSHNPRTRHRGGIGQFRIRAGRHNECGLFQMRVTSRVLRSVCSSRLKKSPRPGSPRVERVRLSSPGITGVMISNQKRGGGIHTR